MGLHEQSTVIITEMEEGAEKKDLWVALDVLRDDRSAYQSLLDRTLSCTHTPRLFFMTSVSGVFEAKEVLAPCRNHEGVVAPYPFLQADLYNASQPALFLFDAGHCVYLWQGWWPEETEEEENVKTGSAEARFNIDRRCALQTTIDYCRGEALVTKCPPSMDASPPQRAIPPTLPPPSWSTPEWSL
jgi:supervillin